MRVTGRGSVLLTGQYKLQELIVVVVHGGREGVAPEGMWPG